MKNYIDEYLFEEDLEELSTAILSDVLLNMRKQYHRLCYNLGTVKRTLLLREKLEGEWMGEKQGLKQRVSKSITIPLDLYLWVETQREELFRSFKIDRSFSEQIAHCIQYTKTRLEVENQSRRD